MGWSGVGQAIFDPLNISGAFGNDTPGPDTTPSTWNGPQGFMGGMAGGMRGKLDQIQQYINSQKPQLDVSPYQQEAPRVAPFQAQWSYSAGKGPQWLEPVDNGTSLQPKRQGDLTWNETVDHGWSSKVNNGPAKGNRF